MKNIALIIMMSINTFAFTADCIVYPMENMNSTNPWRFSITTGQGKLILHKKNRSNPSEAYFYKGKGEQGSFEYANNARDYIEISLGKIKNNKLSFYRSYTNGDSDYGICTLR